jgi:2,3-bisphosphoglycerate-independent phosphoglycerate mutase
MNYAVIIPDGAADEPVPEPGGKTPLEAAHTPYMDCISVPGRQYLGRTVSAGQPRPNSPALTSST